MTINRSIKKIVFAALLTTIGIFSISLIEPAKANNSLSETLTAKKNQTNKTIKELDNLISTLEKITTLDSSQKMELNWLLQAKDFLQKSLASINDTQDYYQAYQSAPLRLKQIEKELATPPPEELNIDKSASLPSLEKQLEVARAEMETARIVRNEIETEATKRIERLQQIDQESAIARKRQEDLAPKVVSSASNGEKGSVARQYAAEADLFSPFHR